MNWTLALPQIELALTGMAVLMAGVARRRSSVTLCTVLTLLGFLGAGALAVAVGFGDGFNGQMVADPFSLFMEILILVGTGLALVLSVDFNRQRSLTAFEFPVLMTFAVLGMIVMVTASSLLSLYVGLELHTLALCVLAAFDRDNVKSSEAGLKYFVLSALATGIMLYGISLVYGFSGTIDFGVLHNVLTATQGKSIGLEAGVILTLIGLAFKVSAAPFHMWTPDVYEGSPTSVTVVFATTPKVAAMALLTRTLLVPFGHLGFVWHAPVEIMAILSVGIGTLGAIGQTSIKRLMAYSSVGHMGYTLIGLAAGDDEGVRGLAIYLVLYVAMSVGAFACIMAMRRRGRSVETLADLAGLSRTDPTLALALAVFMVSLAGVPPVAGFFGKLYVFLAAVHAGLWGLAVFGVLASVVGAFYYLRVVKIMYFDPPSTPFDPRPASLSAVMGLTAVFTVAFCLLLGPLVGAAQVTAGALLAGGTP